MSPKVTGTHVGSWSSGGVPGSSGGCPAGLRGGGGVLPGSPDGLHLQVYKQKGQLGWGAQALVGLRGGVSQTPETRQAPCALGVGGGRRGDKSSHNQERVRSTHCTAGTKSDFLCAPSSLSPRADAFTRPFRRWTGATRRGLDTALPACQAADISPPDSPERQEL